MPRRSTSWLRAWLFLRELFDKMKGKIPMTRTTASTNGVPESIRRVGRPILAWRRRLHWQIESWWHLRALASRHPALVPSADELERETSTLRPLHASYVSSVSRDDMAISLETAAYLRCVVRALRPARVVDLGSGLTSYALRSLSSELGGLDVWSVDDSAPWLERTREFLVEQQCGTDQLVEWQDFVARDDLLGSFDLVLHDLGNIDRRSETVARAIEFARPGGVVMLDDVHNLFYRPHALAALRRFGLRRYSLWRLTVDRYGRHAWVTVRE